MRKQKICSCRITLDINVLGPLLVKGQAESLFGADMCFVKTTRHGNEREPFLPGTSLKGVFRSEAEAITRSIAGRDDAVCLPYKMKGNPKELSCGKRLEKEGSKEACYANSCMACRLFGSLAFGGRISILDGYLVDKDDVKPETETRDGVAIDRKTGGAAGMALFQSEVLTRGRFRTTIQVGNFETWQLGMLAVVLRELEQERIRLGMGTSRGLGHVKGVIRGMELHYYGRSPKKLVGLCELTGEDTRRKYHLFAEPASPSALGDAETAGITHTFRIDGPRVLETLDPAALLFLRLAEKEKWPHRGGES